MIRPRFLAASLLAAALCFTPAHAQMGVAVSTGDLARFRFVRDPQVPIFVPGNLGLSFLRERPSGAAHGVDPLGELACDGWLIEFADPRYDFRASDPDPATTATAGYWARLRSALLGAAYAGAITDFRVTDVLLDEFETTPSLTPEVFASRLAEAWKDAPRQLVSFDLPDEPEAAGRIRDALRRRIPGLLAGTVLRELPPPAGALEGWDFAIVPPGAAPPMYQGQVLMPYLRRECAGLPVMLQLGRTEFRSELFWLATGAAGFQHAALPGPGSLERERDFAALRAVARVRFRFSDRTVTPMPELSAPGCPVAVGSPESIVYLLDPDAARARLCIPTNPTFPDFTGMWYDPTHDQMIIQPRSAAPRDRTLALRKPDAAPWIYCVAMHPPGDDSSTTTPAVRIDPHY